MTGLRRACCSLGFLFVAGFVGVSPAPRQPDLFAQPARGDDSVERAAAALYDGIRTETLPNGLRVFLKPVPGAATVTVMVAYNVGAADEELTQTGLAHYLEHLLFKGTDKLMPGDIDRLTLRHGGSNNAYTTEDMTVYHFDFASEHWEIPLKIEADRMRNCRIDEKHEFRQEKGAVIAELERNEDRPWDLELKAILPLLFGKQAPYGHPVIGERDHVQAATAEIITRFYNQWYHPNNAVLVVCGGFDPDPVMARIRELFGPLPRVELPPRKTAPEAIRPKPVAHEFKSKFELPRMVMGFNTVRTGDPDYYALEVISGILSTGKTSRLYKKLIEGEEIANAASTGNSAGRYPGWFGIYVELLDGKDRKQAEQLVLAELRRLQTEPVADAELKRVQRGIIANAIYARESVHSLADTIATGVLVKDLDFLRSYLPRINAVTAKDVQRVAQKYFDPQQRVVVWSVPEPRKGAALSRDAQLVQSLENGSSIAKPGWLAAGPGNRPRVDRRNGYFAEDRAVRLPAGPHFFRGALADAKAGGSSLGFSLQQAQRVVLPNGLVLLLFENRRLPIVVASVHVNHVDLLEPADKLGIAALVGRLLDEGTAQHKGSEIAEMIENVGGTLSMGFGESYLKVLSPDRKLGLQLLFECLTQPSFPDDALNRHRQQLLSDIADLETQPDEKASMLYNSLVYGKHPFGRHPIGDAKVIGQLTQDDCRAEHRRLCVPNNTIVAIVGDFDTKEMIAEVTRLTANWKQAPLPKLDLPPVNMPAKFIEKIVPMPEAAQLHYYMGHPGIRRNHPDYYKLLVMDYVLGQGPGFTDRLSARLRDRQGLAYSVSASITSSAGEEPGLFTCYIGTQPQHFEKVKEIFLEELKRIREEKPTAQEVEDARKYLLGSLPFRFTTNDRIAGQLLAVERYQLGFGYIDDFRKKVAAVTPEEIQAVAAKHINPARMVLVAVGAIDEKGRPLFKIEKKEK